MDRLFNPPERGRRVKYLNNLFPLAKKAISLVGEGILVVGTLHLGDEVVRLDGRLEGKVVGSGTLIIGQKGVFKGEMNVGTLILCGRVEGTVSSFDCAHITSTGKLFGKIQSSQLIIDEGGILEGESEKLEVPVQS